MLIKSIKKLNLLIHAPDSTTNFPRCRQFQAPILKTLLFSIPSLLGLNIIFHVRFVPKINYNEVEILIFLAAAGVTATIQHSILGMLA